MKDVDDIRVWFVGTVEFGSDWFVSRGAIVQGDAISVGVEDVVNLDRPGDRENRGFRANY